MAKKQPAEGQSDQAFIECIDRLREEVQVLHNVVDELREELQYLVRNPGERNAETVERLHVTSLPLDPAADDFPQRVNAVPESTVAELRATAETAQEEKGTRATTQRGLF
ncbi:MAG TPA: hypothetical protein P5307_06725 [Pirellulaceae bacterium]|nr:hypothetical protein [Pirellulaceae bacterium]